MILPRPCAVSSPFSSWYGSFMPGGGVMPEDSVVHGASPIATNESRKQPTPATRATNNGRSALLSLDMGRFSFPAAHQVDRENHRRGHQQHARDRARNPERLRG